MERVVRTLHMGRSICAGTRFGIGSRWAAPDLPETPEEARALGVLLAAEAARRIAAGERCVAAQARAAGFGSVDAAVAASGDDVPVRQRVYFERVVGTPNRAPVYRVIANGKVVCKISGLRARQRARFAVKRALRWLAAVEAES
jgi:hypothetical protein